MQRRTLRLNAAYTQFYLEDEAADCLIPVDWTEKDVEQHMKTTDNLVVVCLVVEGSVAVEVEVHQSEPPYLTGEWDHIVEGSLKLSSGRLAVLEWPNRTIARFSLAPGCYRVRAFFGNLGSVLSEKEPSEEFYKVVLWPAPYSELRVVKQVNWQKLIEEAGMANILGSQGEPGDSTD